MYFAHANFTFTHPWMMLDSVQGSEKWIGVVGTENNIKERCASEFARNMGQNLAQIFKYIANLQVSRVSKTQSYFELPTTTKLCCLLLHLLCIAHISRIVVNHIIIEMSSTPQGSFGSQPECWEEPGGIMDSIVGIIPRSAYVIHCISSFSLNI